MQRMAMAAAEDGPRVPAHVPVDVQRHHGVGACARKEDEGTTARRAGATMEVHGGGNGAAARWFLGSPSLAAARWFLNRFGGGGGVYIRHHLPRRAPYNAHHG